MKNRWNIKTIGLTAAALVLTAGLSVGTAMAYFTTYAEAQGSVQLHLGFTDVEIDEEVVDGRKEIVLTNTGDFDCYVRLKAFSGDEFPVSYVEEDAGAGKWNAGEEGYYYYSDIVAANGGMTSQINVVFPIPEGEANDFNIIIVQECTPVLYDEDGNPYADWGRDNVKDVSYTTYK